MNAEFQRRSGSPADWMSTANHLMRAASEIEDFPVSLMLAAFAFENVIKGLAVVRSVPAVDPATGKLTKQFMGHHNLAALSDKLLGRPVSGVEKRTLDWLSEFMLWCGRYPIPTVESSYAPSVWVKELEAEAARWWVDNATALLGDGWVVNTSGKRRGPPMPAPSFSVDLLVPFPRKDYGVVSYMRL